MKPPGLGAHVIGAGAPTPSSANYCRDRVPGRGCYWYAQGIWAALRRPDAGFLTRILHAAWFVVMCFLPKRLARKLAIRFLFPPGRGRLLTFALSPFLRAKPWPKRRLRGKVAVLRAALLGPRPRGIQHPYSFLNGVLYPEDLEQSSRAQCGQRLGKQGFGVVLEYDSVD